MSNVTQLRRPTDNAGHTGRNIYDGPGEDAMLTHDLKSPIMFKAYERPLYYKGRDGTEYGNTKHKALVRMVNDKPVTLNVVRDTYKVVQNDELFAAIHSGIVGQVSSAELASARIKDRIAYDGTQCFREYIFPDISFASPERDKIAFRIIIQNGFGTGAIKLLAGAIDFFCTNGLVIGEYTSTYAKHTKGLTLTKFEEAVRGSVHMFWKNKDMFSDLAGRKVLVSTRVLKWLEDKFGERLAAKLLRQFEIEAKSRGRTLWALYSALTYYSSHADGDFGLRNTGNDHAAATMMKRENDVRRIVGGGQALLELAA